MLQTASQELQTYLKGGKIAGRAPKLKARQIK